MPGHMYYEHFGLTQAPFKITPNTDFFFTGGNRGPVLEALIYAITRGGPVNSTHLLATLAFQRGIPGGMLGEGAAIAISMVPFLVFATLFSYFALARRKWQQGEAND